MPFTNRIGQKCTAEQLAKALLAAKLNDEEADLIDYADENVSDQELTQVEAQAGGIGS